MAVIIKDKIIAVVYQVNLQFSFQRIYLILWYECKKQDRRIFTCNIFRFSCRLGSYEKTRYFAQKAIIYSLLEPDMEAEVSRLSDSEMTKIVIEKDEPKVTVKRTVSPDLVEIDLHIHELLEDTRGLTNHEMLEIQMGRFRNELETAIANGTRRIVFIHGIGNGTLKQELRKELNSNFKKYYFQDASFKEYGYGATMVILKNA